MKLMSNLKKKHICAAILCGFVFTGGGHWEKAEAAVDLYGAYNGDIENVNGAAITDPSDLMDSNIRSEKADFTVTGGEWKNIYGGYGATGYIQNNAVTISGGTVVNNNVYGGFVAGGTATQNTVTITGGTVNGNVIGGRTSDGTASKNNVIFAGGEVKGSVYGGYAASASGNASENTITLGDMNNPDRYAQITGNVYPNAGYMTPLSMDGARPGGTVNVYNTGNKVGGYLSVIPSSDMSATLNFYINAADMDATGSKTMLTVTTEASVNGTTINAGVRNVGSVKAGDKITLLKAGKLTVNSDTTYNTMSGDGIMKVDLDFKLYEGDSEVQIPASDQLTNGKLIAIAKNDGTADLGPDSAAKSPVETMAASVSLINAGADMMAGETMTGAAHSVALAAAENSSSTMTPFAAVGGSKTRVESGSHVDLKSWNIAVGFAKEVENKQGKLMFAPVIEYGRGSYDSYLDNGTHGDGTSRFLGIGVMAKQTNKDGLYYEGSLRGGRVKSDYDSNFTGVDNVNYDTSAAYYAMHLGVGKVVKLDDEDSLDCYGKLFYSHQAGDRAHLSNGYDYDFKAVDSIRTRLGVRYTHKINDKSSIYTGLAWQHEFDSKAKATIISGGTSFDAPSPSIKGDTGIFELGWKIKPGKGNFETGLGLTGSVGKQRGVGLNAQFQWMF